MEIREISIEEFAELHSSGVAVIDVREPDEYAEGHVPGAILIPLGTVPDSLDQIPSAPAIYAVCAKGGRSAKAVGYLQRQGIESINVAGGTDGWIAAGKPVVSGENAR